MATDQSAGGRPPESRALYDAWLREEEEADTTAESVAGERDHDVDADRCQNCGAHVTERFRRVFGDNADRVKACPECGPITDRTRGAGALEDPHPL